MWKVLEYVFLHFDLHLGPVGVETFRVYFDLV